MISLIVNGWPPFGELGAAKMVPGKNTGNAASFGSRQMCTASHLVLQDDVVPSNSEEDYRRWHNYMDPVA